MRKIPNKINANLHYQILKNIKYIIIQKINFGVDICFYKFLGEYKSRIPKTAWKKLFENYSINQPA